VTVRPRQVSFQQGAHRRAEGDCRGRNGLDRGASPAGWSRPV